MLVCSICFSCWKNSTNNKYHLSRLSLQANWSDMAGMWQTAPVFLRCLLTSSCWPSLHPQMCFQPETAVWATCAARWDTPTCAAQSRFWPWRQRSPSTPSVCKYNPLEWPPTSSLQVQRLPFIMLERVLNGQKPTHLSSLSSGGVSDGSGPDADSHHRWRLSRRAGADRPHCVPDRQEEEPRWIPDHLIQMNSPRWMPESRCVYLGSVYGDECMFLLCELHILVLSLGGDEKPKTCWFDMLCS